VYGPPFVRDLDKGRRYGTIEDFRNFVKLAYQAPAIHHSGGTVCEPVDVPVNKRHLDMVYSHIRYSDKPFMGSGHRAGARRGHGHHGAHGVRRRVRRPQLRADLADQRQFANGL
jgi:trimethylamine:corrinoid methyltransferase-like protein